MSFKMKGSPAKMGTIQGTAGHSSALKMKEEEDIKTLLDQREASRLKQEKLEAKEAKRDAKRESGKKVFLGKLKTKINKKKVEKEEGKEKEIQKKIDVDPDALRWKREAEKKNAEEKVKLEQEHTKTEKEKKAQDKKKDLDYLTKGGTTGLSKIGDGSPNKHTGFGTGSPAKHTNTIFKHPGEDGHTVSDHGKGKHAPSDKEIDDLKTKKEQTTTKVADKTVKEEAEKTTTKKKSKKEIKKEKKLNKLYDKRSDLKSEGGDVKGGDRVDRKYRRTQNKINRALDSDVRHRKNILTGGKYKKVVKK